MRDGEYISTHATAETTVDEMVAAMVGRDVADLFPKVPAPIGEPVLEVEGLTSPGVFSDVSFVVRAGEIVGPRRAGRAPAAARSRAPSSASTGTRPARCG